MLRWLKVLLYFFVAMVVVLAAMPWWLGAVARPVAKVFGVTFAQYERLGYARFRLVDVQVDRPEVSVTIGTVEAPTPMLWGWRLWRGGEPAVHAAQWRVAVPEAKRDATPSVTTGLPVLHEQLLRVGAGLARLLPRAELGEGEILWPKGGLSVARADWHEHTLQVRGLQFRGREWDGVLTLSEPGAVRLHVADTALDGEVDLTWLGAVVTGTTRIWDQPGELRATFPADSWLPEEFTLRMEQWDVAAEQVKLGAHYARVRGDARLEWREGAFTLDCTAQATPKPDGDAPPFELQVAATGGTDAITVDALHIDTPFASAELSAPATFAFDGRTRGGPARLTLKADLGRQPWFALAGTLEGRVTVDRVGAGEKLAFQLAGSGLRRDDWVIPQASLRGDLQWPLLTVSEVVLQVGEADRLTAHGVIDWQKRAVADGGIEATFGSAVVRRWLPAGLHWQEAHVNAQVAGPLAALEHRGQLDVRQMRHGKLRALDATLHWQGTGAQADEVRLALTNEMARLHLAGRADAQGAMLTAAELSDDEGRVLSLVAPARIDWAAALVVENFALEGEGRRLAFSLGGEGAAFALSAAGIDSGLIDAWLPLEGPAWRVSHWQASGREREGVLHFFTALDGEIQTAAQRARVALKARGDGAGVRLEELNVVKDGRVLTHAAGRLPLVWRMQPAPALQIKQDDAVELAIDSAADSPLWPMLAAKAGVELAEATAHAQITGTLRQPQGELRLDVGQLRMPEARRAMLPDIERLTLAARAERGVITIESLSGMVAGQAVQAHARLPMDEGRWTELWREPQQFDWSAAEGHLEMANADLAPLAQRMPALPFTQGRVEGRVDFEDGKFTGSLRLRDGTARPMGALGLVQEINAEFALDGRRLDVRDFSGRLGGERVTLQGAVAWPRGETQPGLDLTLRGKNLPLIRQAGLLLRGDLDLAAKTGGDGVTQLTGKVAVHDSLVLADLASLLPTGRQGVARQAPYFSVTQEPFRRWRLGMEIHGEQGVRLRTAVLKGVASPQFQLSGTLEEPRAVGEINLEGARVLFPFATFTVQTGVLRLRAANPHQPEIALNASARRHDYELRLAVTGSPESPNVTFTSNPPLDTAQVLLMVMTGQSPAGDPATMTGGQRLTRLGTYLGRGLFGGLDGDENRLEIISGERTSEQGRETYKVEYRLNDRWALTGEYDEFDDYNAGLKWRVFTQESEPREKE